MNKSDAAKKRWADATDEQRKRMGKRTADDPDEFWRRVDKNGPVHPILKTRCYVWKGATRNGYGRFRIKGKFFSAHVHAYEMLHGKLVPGEKVLHRCDNPSCVRDDHLMKGTQRDNVLDAIAKKRWPKRVVQGEHNGMAKLTEKQVRLLRVAPPTTREERVATAERLGITDRSLRRVLSGDRWRHVAGVSA